MSISINYILDEEERKKKQAQTAPVATPDQTVAENTPQNIAGSVPTGSVESRTINYLNNLHRQRRELNRPEQASVQNKQQQQDAFDYSGKPKGWSDDDYRAVRQLYSDDQIQQAFVNPNPEELMNGIYTKMYKENVPEPMELDEKTIRRQRAIAGIGDVIGLLSQAISGNEGAYNRERAFEQSATGRLLKDQQKVYERYRSETDRYGRELVNAQMKDYLTGMQNWHQTQQNIQRTLDAYRKYKLNVAKQQQKEAIDRFNMQNTAKRTDFYGKNIESQIADRKRRTDIEASQAASKTALDKARIEQIKSSTTSGKGGSGKSGKYDYKLVLPANSNDPDAEKDQFGNPIRVFGMSNGEMDNYARKATADPEFMERHKEFIKFGGGSYTSDEKRNIAATYLEEMYASQFDDDEEPYTDIDIPADNQFAGEVPNINLEEQTEQPIEPTLNKAGLDDMFKIVY